MPGVAEKAPGVREHAHKGAEHAFIGEAGQVFPHPAFMVVEPPGAAVLEFAEAAALEAAHDGLDGGVVVGIQRIEDGFRQLVRLVQGAQKRGQILDGDGVPDGVGPRVRTEGAEQAPGIVPDHAEVQLHHHAQAMVLPPQRKQQGGPELLLFMFCGDLSGESLLEDRLELGL